MNFKEWLLQLEAIDANTKELLLKAKAPKDELDAFVKELEDEPNLIDKKTAFQRFQSKFNIQKKVKDEDGQRQFFANVSNTTEEELKVYDYYKDENPQALREMMELLRKFIDKKLITLKFENNKPVLIRNTLQGEQKFDTPDFNRFADGLHQIRDSLKKYTGKSNYFNPMAEEFNHKPNLVAKGDNVWVFKGNAPDLCRIYGKGHPWCISSSTSAAHWFSYRINHHQTQYFVFDFNKDENDPARYVNPGVAPKGMYSEWVDARNQHSTDPEDTNSDPPSEIGINGYTSINQYKKYLASKGIPLDTWTTTPPEEWEKRLSIYDRNQDFQGAKNDDDPRVFPMYIKIVDEMYDSDFETLDKEQKIEFVLGKVYSLSKRQKEFVKTNIKRSDYYSSLQTIYSKIEAARHFKDESALEKIASMPELSEEDVLNLMSGATDTYKIAEIIINNISKIDHNHIRYMFHYVTEKDKIAELVINKNKEIYDDIVYTLLRYADKKNHIAQLLGSDNISKLGDWSVTDLLDYFRGNDQLAEIIIQYKKELSIENVINLLHFAKNKEHIAELLGSHNISRLHDYDIDVLFRGYGLRHITPKNDTKQLAQILNKYHQKKVYLIQRIIDKYLS